MLKTDHQLQTDHAAFVAAGGDLRKAKLFRNVISEAVFNIELDQVESICTMYTNNQFTKTQVCLPGLHISLGIFQRLYDLLEQECHDLDPLLGAHLNKQLPEDATPAFSQYATTYDELHKCREGLNTYRQQLSFLQQALTLLALNTSDSQTPQLVVIRQEAEKCSREISTLV